MKLSDAQLAELEGRIRWAHDMGGEVQDLGDLAESLLAEVRSSRAALARIERAWSNPGAVPSYHERMKRIVQHQWPVLAHAIRRTIT